MGQRLPALGVHVPRSREVLTEILEGVPETEQASIVAGAAAALYGFEVEKVAEPIG